MKRFLPIVAAILSLCLSAPVAAADSTNAVASTNQAAVEPTPAQPAPPISEPLRTDIEALIKLLQSRYVNPAQVGDVEVSRYAVQGIIAALKPGAEIVDATPEAAPTNPPPSIVHNEIIAPMIGYVRFNRVDAAALKDLDDVLEKFDKEKIDSLVLDLRFAKGGSYEEAAALAGQFLLKDRKLFAIESVQPAEKKEFLTTQPSAYIDWKLAMIVNDHTEGAAEAAAGALRDQNRALVVGRSSAGKAVVWTEEALPSGVKVRFATGKVVLTKAGDLFPKGVTVDVPVEFDPKLEREILFTLSESRKVREFVEREQTEPRLNEAALVKMYGRGPNGSTNAPPAKEEAGKAKEKADESKPPPPLPIDVPLQRAVDILKGIRILHIE